MFDESITTKLVIGDPHILRDSGNIVILKNNHDESKFPYKHMVSKRVKN